MQKTNFVLLSFLAFILGGCISEEERQARRDHAFDLAGVYKTLPITSELSFGFEITNQKGAHDILVLMDRTEGTLSNRELAFLERLEEIHGISIPPEQFLRDSSRVILGAGSGNKFAGGENISSNFGESSHFRVCSGKVQIHKSNIPKTTFFDKVIRNPELILYYCLSGTVKSESKGIVEGWLELSAETQYQGQKNIEFFSNGGVLIFYKAKKVPQFCLASTCAPMTETH